MDAEGEQDWGDGNDKDAFARSGVGCTMQEACNRLPDSWIDIEPGDGEKWVGRLTKGARMRFKEASNPAKRARHHWNHILCEISCIK